MVLHILKTLLACMPKMMLPAPWTSCLNDSHTNFQSYIGIGIAYLGKFTLFYAINDAASNQSSCLKDSHINFQINVGVGI